MRKSVIAVLVLVLAASFGAYKVESSLDKPKTNQSTNTVEQPEQLETTSPKEEAKVMQEDTTKAEATNTVNAKVETTPETTNEPFVADFDAQLYAQGVLEEKAKQGLAVNAQCFMQLMSDSTGWSVNQSQVDQAVEKALTQYPSTCAALAAFKTNGKW